MDDFPARLREERKRLKFNQTQFGEIGGVKQDAQSDYDLGKRFPDSRYLTAIAAAGADIQYIITGVRSGTVLALTREDAEILSTCHALEAEQRASLLALAKTMAKR